MTFSIEYVDILNEYNKGKNHFNFKHIYTRITHTSLIYTTLTFLTRHSLLMFVGSLDRRESISFFFYCSPWTSHKFTLRTERPKQTKHTVNNRWQTTK